MTWQILPGASPGFIAQLRRAKHSRFLTDESLGSGVAQFFQWYRMNAVTVWEVGLDGRSDEVVFAYAWKQRRILLTHDDDFWNDRQFPEHRNPGVVILPGANGDQTDMINGLTWMTLLMRRNPEHWIKRKVRISRDGDVYIKSRLRRTGAIHTDHFRFTNGVHAVVAV
jgi:predicted nuclease of predicted toxin-antitoxin system